eukprot:scaffold12631_cov22-Tisochrysis_lutea.AAC.4
MPGLSGMQCTPMAWCSCMHMEGLFESLHLRALSGIGAYHMAIVWVVWVIFCADCVGVRTWHT